VRSIEINTAQNVTIEYELAPLHFRLLAFLLDLAILSAGILILYFLGLWLCGGYSDVFNYYGYFVLIPVGLFYSLVSEVFMNGRSIGKLALGIRTVKLTGKQATLSDYIMRWLFRLIDIYLTSGALAAILVSSTEKNQRIGDIVANTVVIKLRPSRSLTLRDLLNIHSVDSYEPRYPEVKYLSEEDMLLVKNVLERNRKYRNEFHLKAQDELVSRLMDVLRINKLQQEKTDFLRTLLNDYIVLTR
jgi:uncharacterized RDD family membrane protein YckC